MEKQVQLIDSSDFHGSKQNELKYIQHKFKTILENRRLIKIIILTILWFIGGRIGNTYS
jgi:hypothetical protein